VLVELLARIVERFKHEDVAVWVIAPVTPADFMDYLHKGYSVSILSVQLCADLPGANGHFFGVVVFKLPPVPGVAVAGEARYGVKMNVGHYLARNTSVGLGNVHAVGSEPADLCIGNPAHDRYQLPQRIVGRIVNRLGMPLGNDQGMSFYHGSDVHEDNGIVVLKDLGGGQFTGDYAAEDALGTHGLSPDLTAVLRSHPGRTHTGEIT
jgi:hypothetical protein